MFTDEPDDKIGFGWLKTLNMEKGKLYRVEAVKYRDSSVHVKLVMEKNKRKVVGVVTTQFSEDAVRRINDAVDALNSLDKKWALLHIKSPIEFCRNVAKKIISKKG